VRHVLLVPVALWCAAASAQPVFFDDFDGPDLLPHWRTPDPSHWEYSVSDSQLHVTGLFFPGIPHLGGNFAAIGALFEPQTDLRVDAWMGWEPGDAPHKIALQVRGGPTGSGHLADFRYELEEAPGATPMLSASSGGVELVTMPAPPPGIHQFTITRAGDRYEFYLDGDPFASLADPIGLPATGVVFDFLGPSEAPLGSFHIDQVRVVPGPGAPLVLITCTLAGSAIRRRRQPR
jgi:hypothetical protein